MLNAVKFNNLAQKFSDGVGGAPLTFYRIRRGVVGLEKAYSVFSWTALSTPKVGLECWLQIRDENVRRKHDRDGHYQIIG